MDAGEGKTGTRDEHYDLVSVLYHALQGAEACAGYAKDAEAAGESELAAFFGEARETQALLAERAKAMLGIGEASGAISPGGISGGVAPPSTGVQREPGVRADESDATPRDRRS